MPMSSTPLRLLILGAHPDDAEFSAGGLATIYRADGHVVRMISATDGAAGHFERYGPALAARRREEARAAAGVIGAESDVWDFPDGRLQPTLELRERIIREIRTFRPDLVLTHRPNDYHPDHRAVAQGVQDASYMVTVPAVCPDVPHFARDPVVAYLPDLFTRPVPLEPHVVVDVTEQVETIVRMLACHASQVFEWLPYNQGVADTVPRDQAGRHAWLRDWFFKIRGRLADRFRPALIATYGRERGGRIEACEVFEISEYATPLDDSARERLFWFVPTRRDAS
jgi:LmbE family N-acetylglucosaminyl deacetylase